jgi:crotonobetainyl-CoA:carnitine CoA-transferase CaiB-like acyl-CoA transferase
MSGPLQGCTVLDFSMFVAAPMATMLLGEQGADVIKVEPVDGEVFRTAGASRNGVGAWWLATNRNKRSLGLNLKDPRGVDVASRLAGTADVLVHQFRAGVMEKLGLGYDDLRQSCPRLVYASVSGFGRQGPMARRRAYDNVIQAYAGMNAIQGGIAGSDPQSVRTPIADKVAPLILAEAICAALYERTRSGEGQCIDVSMLHSMLWWLWPDAFMDVTFMETDGVLAGDGPRGFPNMVFATKDGHLTVTQATQPEWRQLSVAMEHPEWMEDDRLASFAWRNEHRSEVYELVGADFATRTTTEWSERLEAADVPFAVVNEPEDLVADAQVAANAMLVELHHKQAGRHRQPTTPAVFSRTRSTATSSPELGADTREILRLIGVDRAECDELMRDGVVA